MSSFRPSGHASVRKNLEKIHPSVFARCRKLITMIYEGGSFRSALSSRIISSAHPHLPPGWYFFTPFLLKLITHIYIFHQRENSILQLQNLRILILKIFSQVRSMRKIRRTCKQNFQKEGKNIGHQEAQGIFLFSVELLLVRDLDPLSESVVRGKRNPRVEGTWTFNRDKITGEDSTVHPIPGADRDDGRYRTNHRLT